MEEYEENYSPMEATLSRTTRSDEDSSEESDDEQSKGNAKGRKNKSKEEREKAKEQRKKDKEQRKNDKQQNKKDKSEKKRKGKKNKDPEETDEEPSTQAVALDLSSSDFINKFAGDLSLQRHSRSPQVRDEEQRGKVARNQDKPRKFIDLNLEHPEANLPYIPLAASFNNLEGVERPSKYDTFSELEVENIFSREKVKRNFPSVQKHDV